MTVVEKWHDESKYQFPVGMRVLAVDDDPTCLRLLDNLLRRCQYHVTTTSQAITALKMLRENKNKFDLVISDVHMPDMDGFKLLELVGLEMDLPVIMLSANDDPKVVMKGITHGACDYLLKPVRIEELKNIWQHVIRRKKFDSKDHNNSDNQDNPHHGTGEGGKGPTATGNADWNGKFNRKRKDQNEDDDEGFEESEHKNEDPSTQKKPRVVWSVDLHRKFVAAVNQLGIDKAVPKRILDLMNVDKLTRENKYRLYLKRISYVANHQANMVGTLGGRDSSYLRMGSLDGLGDFHSFAESGQLSNTALASIPPGGMLGRFNTPYGLGLCGLASSGIQLGRAQNSSNSINDLRKLHQVVLPGNQNGSLLQGLPTSLQQGEGITRVGDFSTPIDDPTFLPVSSGFPDTRVTIGSSSNSLLSLPNNPLTLQGHSQQMQSGGGFGIQSSVRMASLNVEPFEIGASVSSHLPDHGRCNENWQSAVQLPGFQSSPLPLNDPFGNAGFRHGNLRDNISSMVPHNGSNPLDVSSTSAGPSPLQDSRRAVQCQEGSIGKKYQHDNPKFEDFGSMGNNVGRSMNYAPKQRWEDHKQDYVCSSNLIFSSLNSSVPTNGVADSLGQSLDQSNGFCNRKMDSTTIGQSNCGPPFLMRHTEIEKSTAGTTMTLKEEYLLEQTKTQCGFTPYKCVSLEDLMSAMFKRVRRRRRLRWERKIQTAGSLEKGFAVYPVLSNVSRRVKEVGGVVQGLGLSEPQVGGLVLAEEGPRSPGGDRRADSVVTDGPIDRTGPLARSVHTPTGSSGRRLLVVGDSAGPKSSYRPGLAGLEKEAQEDRSSSPGLLNSKSGGLLLIVGEARGNIREQEPMGGGNGALSPSELRFQREGGGSGGAVKGIDHSRRLSFLSEVEAAFVTPEHGVRKAREGSGGPESSVVAEAVRVGGELDGGNCGVYKEGLTGRFWDDGSGGSEFEHYTPLVFGELAGEQEVSGLLAEIPGSSNFGDGGPGVDLGTQPVPYLEQRSPASRVEERQGEGQRGLVVSSGEGEADRSVKESTVGMFGMEQA
ncbi:hypothetical protein HHK36_006348 [Tetracentron sinense]|uniref:Response regulatory domain-containing protein n=1 Tax=Tetracentron sinense TaxID=13715 RepID=A0A835DKS5_TETSI|nr:hypothetical protein HHK36_006348 [Tetracentron sinense]